MPPKAPPPTQDNRPFRLTTPLGKDKLLFRRMVGREAVNTLFEYEIEAYAPSADGQVDMKELLGKSVTVAVDYDQSSTRYFNGVVSRCALTGTYDDYLCYRLTLRPQIWLMTRSTDCRIFQQLSIPDILKQVLQGINTSFNLSGSYQPYNYLVQYRETDFNFFSRLCEQEGICYYFTHTDGQHQLVLTDSSNYPDLAGSPFDLFEGPGTAPATAHLVSWSLAREVQSNGVRLWDYHFAMPTTNFEAFQSKPATTPDFVGKEVYDYPGGFALWFDPTDPGGGDQSSKLGNIFQQNKQWAKIRAEEAQSAYEAVRVSGNVRTFYAGGRFSVKNLTYDSNGAQSVVTACTHLIEGADWTARGYDPADNRYHVEATGMLLISDTPASPPSAYRPPRITRKPVVGGPQTAMVVGPSGNEIFVDKYGRVKVQFPWDRQGKKNENSSCWIRVSQPWAGKQWGGIWLPRVGQEVIVDFIEGDPDQPIITGRVYNADQMPPYTLPDNKTQSGFLSRSSLNGTADEFNQLLFEDLKGSEFINFHAQKDYNQVVENNYSLIIGSDDSKYCPDGSRTETIYKNDTYTLTTGDRTETIKQGNETLTISQGNRSETISQGNDSLTISQGNRTETISQGNDSLTLGAGSRTVTIQQNDSLTLKDGNHSVTLNSGDQSVSISSGKRTVTVAQNDSLTIQQGNLSIEVSAGTCSITAGQSITLTVGASSIKIDASGVTITGQPQVQISGAMTTVAGSGTLTLTGGMVMVNS